MKLTKKSFLTTPFVCLILIISLLALPINATAKTGTLGTESPVISCTFVNSNGEEACGDRLYPGDYTVNFMLSQMASVSIFQISGVYDESKISKFEPESYNDRFELGGQKVSNGKFAAFLVSNNTTTTATMPTGVVMLTYSVTVNKSGDFADMVQLSTDPNHTFIEADYGDGYYDCYVLDTSIEYAAGTTYDSTADLSPYIAPTIFTVTGKITVADDTMGTATDFGMPGVRVAVDGTNVSSTTDDSGVYNLIGLEPGDYELTISSNYSAERKATLEVIADNADYDLLTVANVGMVPCDYNKDNTINAVDAFVFSRDYATNPTKSDFNRDGVVNEADGQMFRQKYMNKSVNYSSVSLK